MRDFVTHASLASRSPFVALLEHRDAANAARAKFAGARMCMCRNVLVADACCGIYHMTAGASKSDHMALVAAFDAWQDASANGRGAERRFCDAHFVSAATMREIAGVRQQLEQVGVCVCVCVV
jgi:hypothetical protein